MALRWIEPDEPLPHPSTAQEDPAGLLAAGRDLSADRLVEAYGKGVFPWYTHGQPVLWWSTDPRMVLFLDAFKVTRSLAKTLRRLRADPSVRVTLDGAFEDVMRGCAAPRDGQDGTWITDEILRAYAALHRRGLAHSVEVWVDGRLQAGLYGVSMGRMFYGESMFTRAPDLSKVALAALVHGLRDAGFTVIDCQQNTRHLASLGAREIDRDEFLQMIATLTAEAPPDWGAMSIGIPEA